MRKLLLGDLAPPGRRQRGDLLLAAASFVRSSDEARLRGPMAGSPSAFVPPASLLEIRDACRRVQVRQLFRLALEALLYWTLMQLEGRARTSEALVTTFIDETRLLLFRRATKRRRGKKDPSPSSSSTFWNHGFWRSTRTGRSAAASPMPAPEAKRCCGFALFSTRRAGV